MLNNAQKYNDTRTGEKYNESTNNAASSSLLECCSNLLFGQESPYRMSYNYTEIDPGWGPRVVQNVHNMDSIHAQCNIYCKYCTLKHTICTDAYVEMQAW